MVLMDKNSQEISKIDIQDPFVKLFLKVSDKEGSLTCPELNFLKNVHT
jgi:hypothetical protein